MGEISEAVFFVDSAAEIGFSGGIYSGMVTTANLRAAGLEGRLGVMIYVASE